MRSRTSKVTCGSATVVSLAHARLARWTRRRRSYGSTATGTAPDADGRPASRFLAEVAAYHDRGRRHAPALPFDLRTGDADEADRWEACIERAPRALLAAALLLREPPASTWAGLVAESATYSMLQAGPEFRAWRGRSDPWPADDADAPGSGSSRTTTSPRSC